MTDGEEARREVQATVHDTVELAKALHKGGRLEEAEGLYERILDAYPDQVEALHFLGVLRHQQGRVEEAIDLVQRALVLDPRYIDARNNLGNIRRLEGDLDAAEKCYRRVLEEAPDHADTWNNLGTILCRQDDFEGATAAFRKALDLDSDHAEAWQNLGNLLRRQGKFEEAAEAFRQALAICPEQTQIHLSLGRSLYLSGNREAAARLYEEWLQREPDHPIARHMLAAFSGKEVPGRASDEFVKDTFDAFSADFDDVLTRLKYRAPEFVSAALKDSLPPRDGPRTLLDAGCGTGLCGPLLKPLTKELIGIDLSAAMLSKAHTKKVYDELIEGEVTEYLSRQESRFDGIASADVLVYFGDLLEVSSAAAGALKPGGVLAFTTERSDPEEAPDGYLLHPSGRYSHTEEYIDRTLTAAGLTPKSFEELHLRMEGGEPVAGTLAVAVRKA